MALGMLAERAVAMGGEEGQALGVQICELLLPVVCAPEPAESLPPGFVRPAQGAYWVTEGAAFALLKLCSGSGNISSSSGGHAQGGMAASAGNCVAPTMPSQHSDARFAFGFCELAVRRAEAGGGGAVGKAVLPLLRESQPRWQKLYAAASADVPEPWLGGRLGGGVEWL
jgi:hypothetical protein